LTPTETATWSPIQRWFPQRGSWSRPIYAAWLGGLFLVLAALPYAVVNQFAGWRSTSVFEVETSLDTALPFVPWMMVFYISFYAYFPLLFWMGAAVHRRQQAEGLTQRLIQATWVAFVIFLLFPVEVDLRHQTAQPDGAFAWLFSALHALDTPYNAWPSLHVLQSLLVVLTVANWHKNEETLSLVRLALMWSAWGLLVLSTMLVKQHYLFDVITALIIGAVVWKAWFAPVFSQTTR
jgi:membrane-associated phospholipid phosphatase